MYRVCYFLVVLATGFFFLFALGFLKGDHSGRTTTKFLAVVILTLALLNLTGLTLRSATSRRGTLVPRRTTRFPARKAWDAWGGDWPRGCLYPPGRLPGSGSAGREMFIW
jgi:hypothetical protein